MINEEITIEKREKKEYPPIPKNIYQAEILDVNLNDAKGKFAKPGEKVFSFQFVLLDGKDKEGSLRGRSVWANFVQTYLYIGKSGKNDLYNIIEAVLERELELEEEANFDKNFVNSLIGKQLRLMIEPRVTDKGTYDNVTNYLEASTKINALTSEEKEHSTVKNKKEEVKEKQDEIADVPEEDIKVSDIQF
jgi:hypothetical protein